MADPIRILVVDDHHVVRQGLVALLNIMPDIKVVGEASDGLQAIELHRSLRPDITLMDLQLPKLSGVEAIQKIPADLDISEATVKSHINNLLSKLGVSDRTHAATVALQRGIVHLK